MKTLFRKSISLAFFPGIILSQGLLNAAELSVPSPFKTINEALSQAQPGDVITVDPGTYQENVILKSGVTLKGAGADKSIIDGGGNGSVVVCKDGSVIQGFTIRKSGKAGTSGNTMDAGVKVDRGSATVSRNHIESNNTGILLNHASSSTVWGNRIIGNRRFGVYVLYGKPEIKNNVIAGNRQMGIYSGYAEPEVINNVITESNTLIFSEVSQVTIKQNILTRAASNAIQIAEDPGDQARVAPQIAYNLLWKNHADYVNTRPGLGDIATDPKFKSEKKRDYRLEKGSPAIDAGSPSKAWSDPDGSRCDMGAFGGPWGKTRRNGKQKKKKYKFKVPVKKKKESTDVGGSWESIDMNDKLKKAKANYLLFCSQCHGEKGDGKGQIADALETPPRNHRDKEIMSMRTDEEIFKVISEGGTALGFSESMPPHNTVMPKEDIEGLVKYLRKLCDCEHNTE